MPGSPDGIMVSKVSNLGSSAFARGKKKCWPATLTPTKKKPAKPWRASNASHAFFVGGDARWNRPPLSRLVEATVLCAGRRHCEEPCDKIAEQFCAGATKQSSPPRARVLDCFAYARNDGTGP